MKKIIFLLFLFVLISPSFVFGEIEGEGKTSLVALKLSEAESAIAELEEDGFNVQRVSDLFKAAEQIFESQRQIGNEGNRDFTFVEQYADEIISLKGQVYITRDELIYVYGFYNETKERSQNINLSSVDEILSEMQFEFDSERYEDAYELLDEAYSELVELEGQYTALNLAYVATAKTLKNFLFNNWLKLLIIFVAVFVLFFIFKNRLVYYRTKHKINRLIHESGVLEELIKNTQSGYFEKGSVSESSYRIRIKKFSELMRDINRQLPLLKEALAKSRKREIASAARVTGKSTRLNPEEVFEEKKKKQGFFKRMFSKGGKVKKSKKKTVKKVKKSIKKKNGFFSGLSSNTKSKKRIVVSKSKIKKSPPKKSPERKLVKKNSTKKKIVKKSRKKK